MILKHCSTCTSQQQYQDHISHYAGVVITKFTRKCKCVDTITDTHTCPV